MGRCSSCPAVHHADQPKVRVQGCQEPIVTSRPERLRASPEGSEPQDWRKCAALHGEDTFRRKRLVKICTRLPRNARAGIPAGRPLTFPLSLTGSTVRRRREAFPASGWAWRSCCRPPNCTAAGRRCPAQDTAPSCGWCCPWKAGQVSAPTGPAAPTSLQGGAGSPGLQHGHHRQALGDRPEICRLEVAQDDDLGVSSGEDCVGGRDPACR